MFKLWFGNKYWGIRHDKESFCAHALDILELNTAAPLRHFNLECNKTIQLNKMSQVLWMFTVRSKVESHTRKYKNGIKNYFAEILFSAEKFRQ